MTQIKINKSDVFELKTDALVLGVFEKTEKFTGLVQQLDEVFQNKISSLYSENEIRGKLGEVTIIHNFVGFSAERLVIAGLGKIEEFDSDVVRKVSASVLNRLNGINLKQVSFSPIGSDLLGIFNSAKSIVEGAVLGLYRFEKYKSKPAGVSIKSVDLMGFASVNEDQVQDAVNQGKIIAEAVNLSRDLSNEPSNKMTPSVLSEIATDIANKEDFEIEVFDEKDISNFGMGALIGVASGSVEKPKFIVLKYFGKDKKSSPLCFIGKGITFDSGGISLKPAQNMGDMKGDMAGGASVIAAIQAIAKLKLKINLVVIVPATENMPGGSAQKPGDVVTAMNGTNIEIDNTDAEGRLVLADAISYARTIGVSKIVDVATLTGAIRVALGTNYAGIFGNNDELTKNIIESGKIVGEKIWKLPVDHDYDHQYKSQVADFKNTGGRDAGSITGAQFIGEFAGGIPWAHLDIAAISRTNSDKFYNRKGATGFAVRTMIQFARLFEI